MVLTLTVTDSHEATASASVSITVNNTAPVVSARASPATTTVGGTVTLTGTATDVNAGDTLSYSWVSNNGGTFADTTRLSTTWTATDTTPGNSGTHTYGNRLS